jgi:regulator-associated protein of mTOR
MIYINIGGNSRYLRCWDMTAEKCSNTIEIETGDSCITALTTAWDEDNATTIQSNGFRGTGPEIIVAGLSDGTLKLFDIRMPKSGATMAAATMSNNKGRGRIASGSRRRLISLNNKTFSEHGSWIVDVSFTSYGNQNEILSGCVAGDIRAWDIRMSSRSLRAIEVQRSPMTALSVHKKIPIAATGSHAQFIKILTLEGETLQSAKFHEESLTGIKYDRIGPVSCLEFHHQKLVLAAGSTNALVSVYKPRRRPRV